MAHTGTDVDDSTKEATPSGEKSFLLKRSFLGTKEIAALGLSNLGSSLAEGYMGSFLMYFFTSVFRIDYRYISLMYFLVTIWDAMNDPMMGIVFDKTRTRFGKARPYLLFTPIPLGICVALLFLGPIFFQGADLLDMRKIVYMFITYFLWETFNTINGVPKGNLPLLMSPNPTERNKLFAVSNFLHEIGRGLPSLIIAPMIDLSKSGIIKVSVTNSFAIIGVSVAILGTFLSLFAFFGTRERVMLIPKQPPVLQGVKYVFNNKPLLLQVLAGVMGCLGGIGGIYVNFFYIDVMGSATMSLVCGAVGTVIKYASFGLIPWFFKRFKTKQMFFGFKIYVTVLKAIMFLVGRKFLHNLPMLAVTVIVVQALYSFVDGANGVLNSELGADVQDYMEWQTGTRQEGTTGAVTGIISKFGNAISSAASAIVLNMVGYQQGAKEQSDDTKYKIFAMFAIVPQLLGLFSLIPWFFYDLWGDKRDKMRAELAQMREVRARLYFDEQGAES